MPKTTLAGHPVHPQLIPFPAALMPTSLVFDILHAITGRDRYGTTARHTLAGGILGAGAAATAGALDYLSIPEGGATKRVANVHAAMNVSLLGIFGLSWMLRRDERPSPLAIALSAVGNAGLLISAWYGGHLVYAHGMRVEGRDQSTGPELRAPGDAALEDALAAVPLHVPARGPTLANGHRTPAAAPATELAPAGPAVAGDLPA